LRKNKFAQVGASKHGARLWKGVRGTMLYMKKTKQGNANACAYGIKGLQLLVVNNALP